MDFVNSLLKRPEISVDIYRVQYTSCIAVKAPDRVFILNMDVDIYKEFVALMRSGDVFAAKYLSTAVIGRFLTPDNVEFVFDVPYTGELLKEFTIEFKVHTGLDLELKTAVNAMDSNWIT